MTLSISTNPQRTRTRWALSVARSIALSRPGLMVIGVGTIGLALSSSWGWLAAIGAAPVILAVLPCAAMCALGVCMPMMMGGSKKKAANVIDGTATHLSSTAAPLVIDASTSPAPIVVASRLPITDRLEPVASETTHDCCASTKESSYA